MPPSPLGLQGEIPPGKLGYYPIPVFNFFEGYLSVNFSDNYYFLSQRHPEVRGLEGVKSLGALGLCFVGLGGLPRCQVLGQILPVAATPRGAGFKQGGALGPGRAAPEVALGAEVGSP